MRELTIGRSTDNDIVINENSVSRRHASLIISGSEFSVRDNGSSNGTYINGMRINGTSSLRRNDILKVGNALVPWKDYIGMIGGGERTQMGASAHSQPAYIRQEKLPNSGAALTLGIIGLVLGGLVLNILAIVLGVGAVNAYNNEPDKFTVQSYKNANTGRILGIIGLSIWGFIFVMLMLSEL